MILILIGGLIVIAIVSRGPMSTVVRGSTPVTDSSPDMGPHLSLLTRIIRNGERPDDWLISFAIDEAWTAGNYEMADKLAQAFHTAPAIAAAPPASESPPSESASPTPIAFKKQSPIDHVKDDEWNEFVTSMASDAPTFDTERHRGIFHHHKKRLEQLGIDPSTLNDPDSQYDAFEKDILDCSNRFRAMLKERVTELVQIDGAEHVVTESGMLALLKTGGPKGAEKWLSKPEERKSYPQTTEMFLRANGIF